MSGALPGTGKVGSMKSPVRSDAPERDVGAEMYDLAGRLYPFCRSITGEGVRRTLAELRTVVPLATHEVPSGTKAFDWEVPPEWNIRDAYIKDGSGTRVVDFRESNLHVVGYSIPFEGTMGLDELKAHLHSLPDQPDLIPYVTSYYARRWGFCLTHDRLQALADGTYEVRIDSTLEAGSLTYGDLVVPGESAREIVVSTNICHPSLANNDLSGQVIAVFLARALAEAKSLRYSYRFIFIPETIGAIVYLSRHLESMKRNTLAGYVITCAGDDGPFSYLSTPGGEELVDRVTLHVLEHSGAPYRSYDFLTRGSDERQYCSPGVDLPFGSLMRTKYCEYPEYHTSGDDLTFISPGGLEGTYSLYLRCFEAFENNHTYRVTVRCEPQLGKRGLYPSLSTMDSGLMVRKMTNLIAFCDGRRDLLGIAERIGQPMWELYPIVEVLLEKGLIERVDRTGPSA